MLLCLPKSTILHLVSTSYVNLYQEMKSFPFSNDASWGALLTIW